MTSTAVLQWRVESDEGEYDTLWRIHPVQVEDHKLAMIDINDFQNI